MFRMIVVLQRYVCFHCIESNLVCGEHGYVQEVEASSQQVAPQEDEIYRTRIVFA